MNRRMRVVLAATNGPRTTGGLASYMRELGRALRKRVEVDDVVRFPRTGRPGAANAEVAHPEDVASASESVLVPGRGGTSLLAIASRSVHHRATHPLARAATTMAFSSSVRRHLAADVDHVHWIGAGWELTGHVLENEARARGIGFSVCPAIHPGTWGDGRFDFDLYRRADAVVALSSYERDVLVRGGVQADRVHVIGLGPAVRPGGDGRRFRSAHALGDAPLVLFVGRPDRYKGWEVVRDAMEHLWTLVPSSVLVRCGPSSVDVGGPAAGGRVLDLGLVDEDVKAGALAAATVFCLPSSQESFGLAYVEAWSYGVPVIAGPAPAVAELVQDSVDGFVVEQDAATVGAALVRVVTDDALAARLGANGRSRQQADYTWDVSAERHLAIFGEAGRSSARRRP